MSTLFSMIKRNTKLFFKDKGLFFSSLITPMILLVLYATFLGKVYRDSFKSSLPPELGVSDKLVNGCVAGELFSSLLAVTCITVAFCSNMLSVQDKVNGSRQDLTISPVKNSTLAMSYYLSTLASTLIVALIATFACFIYVAVVGWFMSFLDVVLIFIDIFLLVMFGTVLSSIINLFLTSQGQISAVGTIVSAGYGFICGAYMPISSFSTGLQRVISFLPGTYGTSLIRNHALNGVYREMAKDPTVFSAETIESIKDSIDCNLYFFGNKVSVVGMFFVLLLSVVILLALYVFLHKVQSKKAK